MGGQMLLSHCLTATMYVCVCEYVCVCFIFVCVPVAASVWMRVSTIP